MKIIVAAATFALLAVPALAQSSQSAGSQNPQVGQKSQANGNSTQNLAAVQKIKQDLQREGFTNVKVVAESFVVQGKSPDGDPVVMTIGPHGMSVFEAMNENGSSSGTVGSNSTSHSSNSPSSQPSMNSNSGAQKQK
jgi:hypothetical protein